MMMMRILVGMCFLGAGMGMPFAYAELKNVEVYSGSSDPDIVGSIIVPPGFSVEVAAGPELSSYPMFMEFDPDGVLYIAESSGKNISGRDMVANPECFIYRLVDEDGDGVFDSRTVFADALTLPMGVLWYEGAIYSASPPDFLRLEDTNGDGVADKREVLLTGWNCFNTASLHGPFLGPDGWLYLTHGRHGYAITTKEGELLEGKAARIWRCRPDGTGLERVLGGGFDNPVEMIFTGGGEMLGTMTYFTDPQQGQRDALMHWVEGGAYPKPEAVLSEFIRTGDLMPTMTKFARIAPSGFAQYQGTAFGPDYEGMLFSAHFNPHRIQRHRLLRDGATYRTIDEDFLTSSDSDFHPTDILEDADGSLLVSDTGAWYVDACPISRVSRPEIRGRIYRVRREGVPRLANPRGRALEMEKRSPEELVVLLGDPRPAVREQAQALLIRAGSDAVAPLIALLGSSNDEALRLPALWALNRISGPDARKALVLALQDPAEDVRIAAARVTGLEGDAEAIPTLTLLLQDSAPAVRRQAATALGQLDAVAAVPALLAACETASDRFVEHSLIYALIMLNQASPVAAKLDHPSARVRKAALIALDQMADGGLEAAQLTPLLDDEDEALRKTSLWVASRHPEWSGAVLEFIEARVSRGVEGLEAVGEVLQAYAGDAGLQTRMAAWLETADTGAGLFLLDAIGAMDLSEFPGIWVERLKTIIEGNNDALRFRALQIVRARGISQFDATLEVVADNPRESAALRLAALDVLASRATEASETRFQFLVAHLGEAHEPGLRLAAAKVLAATPLSSGQLTTLANDHLIKGDPLTFHALLGCYQDAQEEAIGLTLVSALKQAPFNPNVVGSGLDAALAGFPETVLAAAAPLFAMRKAEEAQRIERLRTLEPKLGAGDVGRGRRVFFGDKAACSTCHTIGNEGGTLGPDLTTIGLVRSSHDLIEAVLFPSASFVPDYESFRVETEDDVYAGVMGAESPDAITLKTGVDAEVRIPRDTIRSMEAHTLSVMPEGLDAAVTEEELLDLFAFLQSLNNEQWLLPVRWEAAAH